MLSKTQARSVSHISQKQEKDLSTSVVKRLVWDFGGTGGRTFFSMLVSRGKKRPELERERRKAIPIRKRKRREKVMHSGKKNGGCADLVWS